MSHRFLFVRSPDLEQRWPFVPDRVAARLGALGELIVLNTDRQTPVHEQTDLRGVVGLISFFGGPVLTPACIAAAPQLRMVGAVTDNAGFGLPVDTLFAREIPIIDSTRGWAQSVAELGLCLALCALRRVPWWHGRMAAGETLWQYEADQFCDDARFVNGDLGTKRVGVVGLGQIGRRVARWCAALGATVVGYDPFIPVAVAREWGADPVSLDALVDEAEVLFITVPPTPSATKIVSAERVYRLRKGGIVVVVTRAHGIDMDALRERICADELAGAFDVYDVEPLPVDDPLRGRPNVIHVPHIAGRTRDANLRAVDIIVDDFVRLLRGDPPFARLTPEAIDVRMRRGEVPAG
ncbi:MAG: hypothetical protein HY710_04590 [Candidatus Latescibacteria bacterium]|nr:hypothetical protein [Candidatus Latescibacterota bacterium]